MSTISLPYTLKDNQLNQGKYLDLYQNSSWLEPQIKFAVTHMFGNIWAAISNKKPGIQPTTPAFNGYCHFRLERQPAGDIKVIFARNRRKPHITKENARQVQAGRSDNSKSPGVSKRMLKKLRKRWFNKDIDFSDQNILFYAIGLSQPDVQHHFDAGGTIDTLPDADTCHARITTKERILANKGLNIKDSLWVDEFTHSVVMNRLHMHGLLIIDRPANMSLKEVDSIVRDTFKATLVSNRSALYKHIKSMGAKGEAILRATSSVDRFTASKKYPYPPAEQIANHFTRYVTYITDGKEGVDRAQKLYQQPTNPDIQYQVHDPSQQYFKQRRNGIPPRKNPSIPPSLMEFLTDAEMLAIAQDVNMDINSPTEDSQWAVSYVDQPASWIVDQLFESFNALFPQRYQEYIESMGGIPDDISALDKVPTPSLSPEEKEAKRQALQAELSGEPSKDSAEPSLSPEEKEARRIALQAQLFGDDSRENSPESSETAQDNQDDESPQGTSENPLNQSTVDISIPIATPENPLREGPPAWDWTEEPRHDMTEVVEVNGCPVTFSMSYGPLMCPPHLK